MAEKIKCKGRFSDLTTLLNDALTIVKSENNRTIAVNEPDLSSACALIRDDIPNTDPKDPYFDSNVDILRDNIPSSGDNAVIHTVPLVSRVFSLNDELASKYARVIRSDNGNSEPDAPFVYLADWHKRLNLTRILQESRGISIKKSHSCKGRITLDDATVDLKDYKLFTKFGIGRTETDLVVPDAPYSLELYDPKGNMCLLVGFWYQTRSDGQRSMVVAHIQSPKGAELPGSDQGSQMGIVGLALAKIVAPKLGFDLVETYSAERHPMFKQFPDRKDRMKSQFVCIYDSSSKAHSGEGSRTTSYKIIL